jgi:choline dehydrogenase-like flavoprotein
VNDFDVVIIGSGAGGGTLARYLAERGQKVAVIERGDWVKREPYNWDAQQVFGNGRYVSPDQWRDNRSRLFQPGVHYNVGGATKFYGAALYRMRPEDFGEIRHYAGASPAWPIGYDDMKAAYYLAEHEYHVHGGDGSAPYPAVRHEPVIADLAMAMHGLGWNPADAP